MHSIRQNIVPFITGDGTQSRDMLHVSDAVEANIFAMNREENFKGEHYDIGTGENISLNEIKDIVQNYFPDINFDYVEERKGDVMSTRAENQKIKDIGWETKTNIKEGINNCFKRLKDEK